VCNAIVENGKIPEYWSKSWLISVYNGKIGALECGSYRDFNMLKRVLQICEGIIEVRVREGTY